MEKFEIIKDKSKEIVIDNKKITVYRIKALDRVNKDVKAGQLGGYVQSVSNLNQFGECWIYDDAIVCQDAKVLGNAKVKGNALCFEKCTIHDNATVEMDARISGKANIYEDATVSGISVISARCEVYGDAYVCGSSDLHHDLCIATGNVRHFNSDDLPTYASIISSSHRKAVDALRTQASTARSIKTYLERAILNMQSLENTIDIAINDEIVEVARKDFINDIKIDLRDTSNVDYAKATHSPVVAFDTQKRERLERVTALREMAVQARTKKNEEIKAKSKKC